jgi:hypothetical protein
MGFLRFYLIAHGVISLTHGLLAHRHHHNFLQFQFFQIIFLKHLNTGLYLLIEKVYFISNPVEDI